jgi:hypothetical protein
VVFLGNHENYGDIFQYRNIGYKLSLVFDLRRKNSGDVIYCCVEVRIIVKNSGDIIYCSDTVGNIVPSVLFRRVTQYRDIM